MSRASLFRLEAKLLLRQRSTRIALASLILINVLASLLGLQHLHKELHSFQELTDREHTSLARALSEAEREDAGQLKLGQFRDPRDISNFVRVVLAAPAIRLPLPGAALDVRRGTLLPHYFLLNTGPQSKTITAYEYDNPHSLVTGLFDVSFVLVFLLPLFLITLGYGIWTTDRELNVDRLVAMGTRLSHWVYLRRLCLAVSIPAFIQIVSGWITIAFTVSLLGSAPGKAAAFFALAAIVLLYTSFWAIVIFIVITHAPSSSTSLLLLMGAYLVMAVVIPSLASWHANTAYPQLSRADFLNTARKNNDRVAQSLPALSRTYLRAHPELGSTQNAVSSGGQTLIASESADALNSPINQQMQGTLLNQQRIVRNWSLLSPALLTEQEVDRLSGEDLYRQQAFVTAARGYISQLQRYFSAALFVPPPLSAGAVRSASAYPKFGGLAVQRSWWTRFDSFAWTVALIIAGALMFTQGHRSSRP